MAFFMKLQSRYIVLPVNNRAECVRLAIRGYSLDVKYDDQTPAYNAYIDVGRLIGREVSVTLPDGKPAVFSFADTLPDDTYAEPYRPQVRFSAARGWTNDPNGLIYAGGRYHMFFQHNPAGTEWGNMHWGHAVSADLVHWDYDGDVLFPDELGTVYSGSAILDERNVSGLGKNGIPPILLYYTAAGKPFTQCLAYSADNGETFEKYTGNPIIGHIAAENRDPKVIWCDELGKYVMALYLDGNEYLLLVSDNLINWDEHQRIILPNDAECPDFYPLPLDGRERKWVFSGASDYYFTGSFVNGKFTPDGPSGHLFGFGRESYAAQTFSGLPDCRRVRVAWNTTWKNFTDSVFSMSMTFPAELELRTVSGRPTLCARPVREIASLFTDTDAAAYYLTADVVAAQSDASLNVCGVKLELPFTGADKVELILDRDCWELYLPDGGKYYIGAYEFKGFGDEKVTAERADISNITLRGLKSIWKK